jgi:cyclopropane fatty-acyl-phospholipid synthase-like methyltransferase
MNWSHVGVTRWGLGHAQIQKDATILDVGCGGGRTINTLAGLAPQGKV